MKGFTSFPKAIETNNDRIDKIRGKPEKFAEHYHQATLFFESQTPGEQAHIIGAFVLNCASSVPAIRSRMVSSLLNVSDKLVSALAEGLGLDLPESMPLATESPITPEIRESPALSPMARPGDGALRPAGSRDDQRRCGWQRR